MILELGWKEQGIMDSKPAETWSHQRSSGAESPLDLASSSLSKADRIRGEIFCSFPRRSKVICPYSLWGLSNGWWKHVTLNKVCVWGATERRCRLNYIFIFSNESLFFSFLLLPFNSVFIIFLYINYIFKNTKHHCKLWNHIKWYYNIFSFYIIWYEYHDTLCLTTLCLIAIFKV